MNKFKSLEMLYEEQKRNKYTYKKSTINERELLKAITDLDKKKKLYQDTEIKAENARTSVKKSDFIKNKIFTNAKREKYLRIPSHTPEGYDEYVNGEKQAQKKAFSKARHDSFIKALGSTRRDYKKAQRTVERLKAMLKSATSNERPKAPPTLRDKYANMVAGKEGFKSNHGSVHPMDHNHATFNKFSNLGKQLYYKIQKLGNQGKAFEPYEDINDDEIFKSISGEELANVMRLALDMGYELSNNLYFKLEELSPTLAQAVSNYEGHELSHGNAMRSDHPYYRHIKNQYMNQYNGDEDKSQRMTKMFRKQTQSNSKMMNG